MSASHALASPAMTAVQFADPAVQTSEKEEKIKPHLTKARIAQKSLLVLTVGCAIIASIPPLRLAGSFALRATALLASGVNCIDSWKKESIQGKFAQVAKIAVVVVGIAALAAASPVLIAASLAADIAIQSFEFARAAYHKEPARALCHLGAIAIDALAIAGILAGSWQLMVTAASVSAAMMAGLTIHACVKAKSPSDAIEILCYTALTAIGISSAVTTAQIIKQVPVRSHFLFKNRSEDFMLVYDKHGNVIGMAAPGESVCLDLNSKDLFEGTSVKILYVGRNGDPTGIKYQSSQYNDTVSQVHQNPLPAKDFPTIPIGGTSIVTEELR